MMLRFSVPVITEFASSEIPSIWSFMISWLKPPYLYLLLNFIIITIVASSKLQVTSGDSLPVLSQPEPVKVPTGVYAAPYDGFALKNEAPEEFDVFGHVDASVSETNEAITVSASAEMDGGDEFVISKSSWTAVNRDSTDYGIPAERPPVSARFGHRKGVKSSPEGGRTLGVTKPKRQDTLESTWKTITDGRSMPLTRHLRKSDTWEAHGRHHTPSHELHHHQITKSETFNGDRGSSDSPLLSPSPGSGKLRKEPSLGQDELNKRVEAFIKKFNEDMRLQRQESLNQYREMISRGAH
ncbi:hypothetical protein RJ639_028221 [Escallonia herrerae]|uniref:DUF4408 domain-containing protein n=1 Tax=Escallonia herrerae TaxID=1293975 RepID=A0AA89BQI2_9ASTE|nr:hypothetical protein RJ639_028221 [Escallonia herrerae]